MKTQTDFPENKKLSSSPLGRLGGALVVASLMISLMAWMAPTSYLPTVENDFIRFLKKRSVEANAKLPE